MTNMTITDKKHHVRGVQPVIDRADFKLFTTRSAVLAWLELHVCRLLIPIPPLLRFCLYLACPLLRVLTCWVSCSRRIRCTSASPARLDLSAIS